MKAALAAPRRGEVGAVVAAHRCRPRPAAPSGRAPAAGASAAFAEATFATAGGRPFAGRRAWRGGARGVGSGLRGRLAVLGGRLGLGLRVDGALERERAGGGMGRARSSAGRERAEGRLAADVARNLAVAVAGLAAASRRVGAPAVGTLATAREPVQCIAEEGAEAAGGRSVARAPAVDGALAPAWRQGGEVGGDHRRDSVSMRSMASRAATARRIAGVAAGGSKVGAASAGSGATGVGTGVVRDDGRFDHVERLRLLRCGRSLRLAHLRGRQGHRRADLHGEIQRRLEQQPVRLRQLTGVEIGQRVGREREADRSRSATRRRRRWRAPRRRSHPAEKAVRQRSRRAAPPRCGR